MLRLMRQQLADLKSSLASVKEMPELSGVDWYPYDTLGTIGLLLDNLPTLEGILKTPCAKIAADIGTGDGATAFFLERMGFEVDALDHHQTNFNSMTGVRSLASALHSDVRVFDVDLDGRPDFLPGSHYDLVIATGLLYHLKSPYVFLEQPARKAEWCALSTRVTRCDPEGHDISQMSVAYFLDKKETNGDPSNYWIVTEKALRRAARRAGWEIREMSTVGPWKSDPCHSEKDARALVLLESRYRAILHACTPTFGWHQLEDLAWRWTQRRFGFEVRSGPVGGACMSARLVVPEALLQQGPVDLRAASGGELLHTQRLELPGEIEFTIPLPEPLRPGASIDVAFELDHAIAQSTDQRELGLIAAFFDEPEDGAPAPAPLRLCPLPANRSGLGRTLPGKSY